MRSWKLLALGAMMGAISVLAVLFVFLFCVHKTGPSLSDFSRLRVGMTEPEVEQILGKGTPLGFGVPAGKKVWMSEDRRREICADFADNGTLEAATFSLGMEPLEAGPPNEESESLIDRLLRLFGR